MKAFRLLAPGRAVLTDVRRPRPAADEVLVRVLAAGVCRTDLSLIGAPRAGALPDPVTLGHEIAGEVVEVGPRVSEQHLGTRVAVYELIGCSRCAACARGEDNLCRGGAPGAIGITRDGGIAEYVVVPVRNLVRLDGLDPVQAAPLTDAGMTAFHAVARGRPFLSPGGVAVVIGIGGLGHLAVQCLLLAQEVTVVAVDARPGPRGLAIELGAHHAVELAQEAIRAVLPARAESRVEAVFDFVGTQETLDLAASMTARGGAIVLTGGGGGRLCLTAQIGQPAGPAREVMLVHTFGGARRDLAEVLALASESRLRTRVETFGLADAGRAIERLEQVSVTGRAVIVP